MQIFDFTLIYETNDGITQIVKHFSSGENYLEAWSEALKEAVNYLENTLGTSWRIKSIEQY